MTMSRLGQDFSVFTMTRYTYVPGKDEVVDLLAVLPPYVRPARSVSACRIRSKL